MGWQRKPAAWRRGASERWQLRSRQFAGQQRQRQPRRKQPTLLRAAATQQFTAAAGELQLQPRQPEPRQFAAEVLQSGSAFLLRAESRLPGTEPQLLGSVWPQLFRAAKSRWR